MCDSAAFGRIRGRSPYSGLMANRYALRPEVVRALGEDLGHSGLIVLPRGARWVIQCSCGYVSAGRQYPRLAAEAGILHLENAIKRYRASGKPWPDVSDDTPVEDTSESRRTIVA